MGAQKKSGLAYCMRQWETDINRILHQGACSCQWLSVLVPLLVAAGPRVRQEFPVLVNLYCAVFLSLGLSGNSLFCTGPCNSCCCCQQKLVPPVTMMDVLLQLIVILIPDHSIAGKCLPDPLSRSRESRQDGLACKKP